MFKKISAVTLVMVLGFFTVKADEGMWLPLLLSDNEAEMQELGLQLTAEDIYSINKSSLKDAVVSLGGLYCKSFLIKVYFNKSPLRFRANSIT